MLVSFSVKNLMQNIRNRITERKSFISGKFFKDFLSRHPHRIFIENHKKRRLNYVQELYSYVVVCSVPEKSYRFAYNIPCTTEYNFMLFAILKKLSSFFIIGVIRT